MPGAATSSGSASEGEVLELLLQTLIRVGAGYEPVAFLFPKTNLVTMIDHEGISLSFKALFSGLFALSKRVEHPWD